MTLNISFDEILKEIARISEIKPNGFTVREMVVETGQSENWCRNKLRELIDEGKVACVGRTTVTRIDGTKTPVPAYNLVRKK